MIIGIDANEANTSFRVGVGQYAFNILWSLYRLDTKNSYLIYLENPVLADLPPARDNWQYLIVGPHFLWTRIGLPLCLFFGKRPDVFYTPSHYSPYPSVVPTIPTIHDIGYLKNLREFNRKDAFQLKHWTVDSLRQAGLIVAVSRFTKNELINTYHLNPAKIFICPNGVSHPPSLKSSDSTKILAKFKITPPYFLAVGTLKPNKNYPFLIRAFSQYLKTTKNDYQLVIAGKKGWIFDNIFETVKSENLEKQVIFTDYISETEKWHLYQNALATVIPSTYEGFGIPAIESQKIGTPVIAANIPSLTEVLNKSALFIDPTDISTLVTAFSEIQKPTVKKSLIDAGLKQSSLYTWDNSAKSLLQVFRNTS